MFICLSVVLGISNILAGQTGILNSMGNSVRAIYIGDSGIEKTLYYDRNSSIISSASGVLGATATSGICYSIINNCNLLTLSAPGASCNYSPTGASGTAGCLACTDCSMSFPGQLPNGTPFNMNTTVSSQSTSTDSFFQATGKYNNTSRLIELDISN